MMLALQLQRKLNLLQKPGQVIHVSLPNQEHVNGPQLQSTTVANTLNDWQLFSSRCPLLTLR